MLDWLKTKAKKPILEEKWKQLWKYIYIGCGTEDQFFNNIVI